MQAELLVQVLVKQLHWVLCFPYLEDQLEVTAAVDRAVPVEVEGWGILEVKESNTAEAAVEENAAELQVAVAVLALLQTEVAVVLVLQGELASQ